MKEVFLPPKPDVPEPVVEKKEDEEEDIEVISGGRDRASSKFITNYN